MRTSAGPRAAPRPARARDADSTRADLLRAAKTRFTMLGYDRTTSRDIATDAGANVSLINRYFGSKEGLFEAVVAQTASTLTELPATSMTELVDQLIAGLAADAWPEHGNEHPLLLLLRGMGADERTADLRRRVLRSVLTSMTDLLPPGGGDRQLRADVLLALFAGVLVLRDAVPDSAVSSADPAALRQILQRAAEAIAAPD